MKYYVEIIYNKPDRTLRANSNTLQYNTIQYSTILYNTLNYAIVSRHQINTCTVLHSSVLYCIKREGWKRKMRKFAYRQTDKEHRTDVSKTEVHSFLSGSFPDTRGSWPIMDGDKISVLGYVGTIWNVEGMFVNLSTVMIHMIQIFKWQTNKGETCR